MATENIQITLKLNADGASAQLKNFKGEIVASKIPLADVRKEFGNFVLSAKQAERTLNTTKQSFNNLGKSIGGFKTATGSASASALELGRVVSDMPYGIRGVANNISQFASMMAMSSRATDAATGKIVGLSGAIKGLWAALMGPLGILLAIQAVISAIDFFYGGMKKSTEATEDLDSALKNKIKTLKLLNSELIDSYNHYVVTNDLLEHRKNLVNELAKTDKNLAIILKDTTKTEDERNKSIEKYIKSLELESEKKVLISKLNKEINDTEDDLKTYRELLAKDKGTANYWKIQGYIEAIEKRRRDILNDILNINTKISKLSQSKDKEGSVDWWEEKISTLKKERDALSDNKDAYDGYVAKIKEAEAELEKITGKKDKGKKDKKISPFKTPKELEIDVANNLSAIQQLQRKTELLNAKTAEEKLEIELKWEKEALHLKEALEKDVAIDKFTKYKKGLDDKLEAYKKSLEDENGVLSEKDKVAIKDAEKRNKDAILLAETETDRAIEKITKKYEALFPFWETLSKARRKALSGKDDSGGEVKKDSTDEYLTNQLKKYAEYAETAKGILSSITSFIDGEFDRELAIEKNKTNAINNELNQRLLNENLSKDERKSIQNQIAKNDELLRQKQEKIEKRRFEMNKAASIAKAVVDTYAAAVGVMKDASGGFFSRLAQAIPTIAFGLAQVATIARQKFVSSAGARTPVRGGGGGSSSGGNDRSFNFNLVGNTQANQIADAIQGRFKQPLKAFVVSRDITTQQELDANIKGSASF